jgi:hypothetical protein
VGRGVGLGVGFGVGLGVGGGVGAGVGGTLIVIVLPGSSSRLFARSLERNRTVYVPTGKVIERVYGSPWSQLLDPVLDMS